MRSVLHTSIRMCLQTVLRATVQHMLLTPAHLPRIYLPKGRLSGFRSHCDHHCLILELLITAKQRFWGGPGGDGKQQQQQQQQHDAQAALEAVVLAFLQHAEAYDALYAGVLS